MGAFTSGYVSKKTTGLIVLPRDHKQVLYKQRSIEIDIKRAAWACDQCRACTDMCPRYLLGHRIEPHIIMRLVGQQRADAIPPEDLAKAYLCCQCGLCGMFACPTTISPDKVIAALVGAMKEKGVARTLLSDKWDAHPIREGIKIPVGRIYRRIDVLRYDVAAPLKVNPLTFNRVLLTLHQNVCLPFPPLVPIADPVSELLILGTPP